MNVEAHFDWVAPAEFFFLSPPQGSPQEICESIRRDVAQRLSDLPSARGLEEYYNIYGATRFVAEGVPLPPKCLRDDVPGESRYRLRVESRGTLYSQRTALEMASWDQEEMWTEIDEFSDLQSSPEQFRIQVEYIG